MTDKEFWDISFQENQSALAAHHQRLATPKFIQPDLPFPTQAPIVAPQIGDRIVEIDTFLPRACQIISP